MPIVCAICKISKYPILTIKNKSINGGVASGASGSTSGNGNAGNGGIAIGPGSVADGTSGTGNGNGNSRSVALDGGHTSQGCTDAIG